MKMFLSGLLLATCFSCRPDANLKHKLAFTAEYRFTPDDFIWSGKYKNCLARDTFYTYDDTSVDRLDRRTWIKANSANSQWELRCDPAFSCYIFSGIDFTPDFPGAVSACVMTFTTDSQFLYKAKDTLIKYKKL